jgi:CHRD domain
MTVRGARLAIAVLLSLAHAGYGATLVYTGTLSGAAQSPPVASSGTGFTTVTYDTVAHTLLVGITFSGLTGTTTASHIHCCVAAPGNIGVATETPSFSGFPLGVTSGSYSHVFDLTLAASWNPAFVTLQGSVPGAEAALATGLAGGTSYLNIHTDTFPGGEIRSFLTFSSPVELLRFGAE